MRNRSSLAVAMAALVFFTSLFSSAAFAAGNYTQAFSSTPSNWQSFNDTFVATGGYYATQATTGQPQRAIAVYNGTTWSTNYTYSVKLYSDYEADGNRVGIIFNFVDINNYDEMSISMRKTAVTDPDSGHALLSHVSGGVSTPVGTEFHPSAGQVWPTRDTFFTVSVTRSGTSTTLKVGDIAVFTTSTLPTTAGRVGFFSQFNNGRFDDVNVVDTALTYLFRSGFNSPVALTPVICRSGFWFQSLSGSDVSGSTWPPRFWDLDPNRTDAPEVFNTSAPCDDPPMSNYVVIDVTDKPGPTGATSKVLLNKVVQWHPTPTIEPRAGVNYTIQSGATPPDHFYMRRWLKYPANFMTTQMGVNSWFTQHEYKTGCGASRPGRLLINWERNAGVAKYHLTRDNNNNCGGTIVSTPLVTLTAGSGTVPAMPQGTWFYDEVYMSYPSTGTGVGVVKYAINGDVIFDYATSGSDVLPSLPNRVKLTPGYLNAENVEIQVDDLEVLAELPCASFPCGSPTHVVD